VSSHSSARPSRSALPVVSSAADTRSTTTSLSWRRATLISITPGQVVGEIIYAELDDRLAVVGVLDDGAIAAIDRPVFWSGTYAPCGGHGSRQRSFVVPRARVLGMSLKLSPANSTACPVSWMAGDLRDSVARFKWPVSWRHNAPLLARALDYRRGMLETRAASRPVDRRDHGEYPWSAIAAQPTGQLGHRPMGPWEHGPPCPVLSVR
jgi:hypothetical protein